MPLIFTRTGRAPKKDAKRKSKKLAEREREKWKQGSKEERKQGGREGKERKTEREKGRKGRKQERDRERESSWPDEVILCWGGLIRATIWIHIIIGLCCRRGDHHVILVREAVRSHRVAHDVHECPASAVWHWKPCPGARIVMENLGCLSSVQGPHCFNRCEKGDACELRPVRCQWWTGTAAFALGPLEPSEQEHLDQRWFYTNMLLIMHQAISWT